MFWVSLLFWVNLLFLSTFLSTFLRSFHLKHFFEYFFEDFFEDFSFWGLLWVLFWGLFWGLFFNFFEFKTYLNINKYRWYWIYKANSWNSISLDSNLISNEKNSEYILKYSICLQTTMKNYIYWKPWKYMIMNLKASPCTTSMVLLHIDNVHWRPLTHPLKWFCWFAQAWFQDFLLPFSMLSFHVPLHGGEKVIFSSCRKCKTTEYTAFTNFGILGVFGIQKLIQVISNSFFSLIILFFIV